MWGQQREVFPGLDSGPNGSEGHYSMPLEKRPSADPTYTTNTNSVTLTNRLFDISPHISKFKATYLKIMLYCAEQQFVA